MKVSILGCGWFGRALAQALIAKSIQVKGSATSREKMDELAALGIDPYLVRFPEDGVNDAAFFNCDMMIVSIPPKLRKGQGEEFSPKIKQIINAAKQYNIPKVIYISSTGVYGANQGLVNELTEPLPGDESSRLLLQAEQLFLDQANFTATIIRFGGLVGPGRHPGRFFAGKTDIANGLAAVNMVHLDDAVGVTLSVMEKAGGRVFNASSPSHPTRADFYNYAAQALGLPVQVFKNELLEQKVVDSVNIKPVLNYQFKHDNWMADLFD